MNDDICVLSLKPSVKETSPLAVKWFRDTTRVCVRVCVRQCVWECVCARTRAIVFPVLEPKQSRIGVESWLSVEV